MSISLKTHDNDPFGIRQHAATSETPRNTSIKRLVHVADLFPLHHRTFHLVKNMLYFLLLVLNGIYQYSKYRGWTTSCTTLKPWETSIYGKPVFVGIYRGIIPGFLSGGAKWISSIHSCSLVLKRICQKKKNIFSWGLNQMEGTTPLGL